jgi:hypothetical protein
MAPTFRSLLLALGFVFSAAVNANPSMPTGSPEAQQAGDCKWPLKDVFIIHGIDCWPWAGIVWYSPQLRAPPETCNDVVNMHPGLDLATLYKLNPTIHPYCDNMQIGQKVCIRATQDSDCPKLAEPSPKPWGTSTIPKPQESSPVASLGWHWYVVKWARSHWREPELPIKAHFNRRHSGHSRPSTTGFPMHPWWMQF